MALCNGYYFDRVEKEALPPAKTLVKPKKLVRRLAADYGRLYARTALFVYTVGRLGWVNPKRSLSGLVADGDMACTYAAQPKGRELLNFQMTFKVGGFGGMIDLERKELEVEFSRLEAEIEDLKMVRDSPERREQIIEKTARSQVISVKLMGLTKR